MSSEAGVSKLQPRDQIQLTACFRKARELRMGFRFFEGLWKQSKKKKKKNTTCGRDRSGPRSLKYCHSSSLQKKCVDRRYKVFIL